MKLRFMPTKSNPGAVVSALRITSESIGCLATEKVIFENFSSVRFVLNYLEVVYDVISYSGMYPLMPSEDRMK